MASGGISGVAVGVITAGALLVYAGIKDISPLDALRAVAGGNVPVAATTPAAATPSSSGTSGLVPGTTAGSGAGGGGGGGW